MTNESKHDKSKNELEQFIADQVHYMKENKDKVLQYVCLCLLVVLAIWGIRLYLSRDNSALQADMDKAYYLATQRLPFVPSSVPNATVFEEMAKTCRDSDEAAILRVSAGEAHLKAGVAAITNRRSSVNDSQAEDSEGESSVVQEDPNFSFDKAIKYLEEVANFPNIKNSDVKARATYGLGTIMEQLAGIAKDEADVAKNLDKATVYYQTVMSRYPDSPFAMVAQKRLDNIALPLTKEFYAKISKQYNTLPEKKTDTGVKADASSPLTPTDDKVFQKVEEFSIETKPTN